MKRDIYLSVIIPVYNETKRLKNIYSISSYLSLKHYTSEIIIVDDGSIHATKQKLRSIAKDLSVRIITIEKNKGKGNAIKTGMLAAHGTQRLFTDIDLSTPISTLEKFITYFGKYNIIIGSRRLKNSDISLRQSFIRENLGRIYTAMSRRVAGLHVSDFTCGFKCFSKNAAKKIFTQSKIERWGFDTEILYLAFRYKYKIKEVPVAWKNDPLSKVKFPKDILGSLRELVQIKINILRDFYA